MGQSGDLLRERTARTVNRRDGKYDGPVPNVFASTAGRAVSRRSKEGLGASGLSPRKRDIASG